MPAEVGLPCVTFLATLILSREHSGLHVWLLSGASRVMIQRGDRVVQSASACFEVIGRRTVVLHSKCNMGQCVAFNSKNTFKTLT